MSNPTKFFSDDDPRLTAFALGELEGEELAAVEAALRDDPAARAAVEQIRATAAQLEAALGAEAAADLAPVEEAAAQRVAILPGKDPAKLDGGGLGELIKFPKFRFPQLYYLVGGLAAAAFAILVVRHEPPKAVDKKVYTELRLAKAAETTATNVAVNAPAAAEMDQAEPPARGAKRDQRANGSEVQPTLAQAPYFPAGDQLKQLSQASGLSTVNENYASNEQRRLKDEEAERKLRSDQAAKKVTDNARPEPMSTMVGPVTGGALATSDVGKEEADAHTLANLRLVAGKDQAAPKSKAAPASPPEEKLSLERQTAAPLQAFNTESYAYQRDNDFLGAAQNPLSTFSIDVDTASYATVRRFLANGERPPVDAVRIEELVNYFPYHYAPPNMTDDAYRAPFAASLEVADAPWAPGHRLVRIGLKGYEVSTANRAAANLVFLLDVSGSMDEPNKLPLVKESMRLLVGKLRPDDRVAIVVYAGASGLALPSTPVAKSAQILAALDQLTPGGSTNGAMGIQLAYDVAKANFVPGGLNRVILCTDGDFNVGVTNEGDLTRLITEKAKSGVFLTVLGFGMGNYKDSTLEKLADQGNGNYGYIDTLREAQKLLVEQVNGTLMTIAKDVKLQVEFNPAQVASYRLIGYENRLLKKEDFNNDTVDAGEIGAGHTVTALYEIVPIAQAKGEGARAAGAPAVDELRYRETESESRKDTTRLSARWQELLTLKVRYKEPTLAVSRKLEFPLKDSGTRFADASTDFKFAAAVAEFGMILRGSPHKGNGTLADVRQWAEAGTGDDAGGYRAEFVDLVRQAEALP